VASIDVRQGSARRCCQLGDRGHAPLDAAAALCELAGPTELAHQVVVGEVRRSPTAVLVPDREVRPERGSQAQAFPLVKWHIVGATGIEPVTSSVSGPNGRSTNLGAWGVELRVDVPLMTTRDREILGACGPGVAQTREPDPGGSHVAVRSPRW
jgi:hypothetical protein